MQHASLEYVRADRGVVCLLCCPWRLPGRAQPACFVARSVLIHCLRQVRHCAVRACTGPLCWHALSLQSQMAALKGRLVQLSRELEQEKKRTGQVGVPLCMRACQWVMGGFWLAMRLKAWSRDERSLGGTVSLITYCDLPACACGCCGGHASLRDVNSRFIDVC